MGKHKNDDHSAWKSYLKTGECILYSCAECFKNIVGDVETALIYKNKPKENTNSVDSYMGDTRFMRVKLVGQATGTLKETGVIV